MSRFSWIQVTLGGKMAPQDPSSHRPMPSTPPISKPPSSRRSRPRGPTAAQVAASWRGGLAVGLVIFGVSVGASFLLDEEFESKALLEISDGAPAEDRRAQGQEQVEQLVGKMLENSPWLSSLAREMSESGISRSPESVRSKMDLSARSSRTFSASFRAPTPDLAQQGCRRVAAAIVAHFGAAADPGTQARSQAERQAIDVLERRTRELADFVVKHPNLVLEGSSPAPTPSSASKRGAKGDADSTIAVLRQERARLQAEIAKAEAEAQSPVARDNPYDEPTVRPDVGALKQRLTEVKSAISARQRVLEQRADTPRVTPVIAPPASIADALVAEWRRLVQAVTDAQKQAPSTEGSDSLLVARVVEDASLPSRPATLRRALTALGGGMLGLALGLAYAFTRARRTLQVKVSGGVVGAQPAVPQAAPPAMAAMAAAAPPVPAASAVDPNERAILEGARTVAMAAVPLPGGARPSPSAPSPVPPALPPWEPEQAAGAPQLPHGSPGPGAGARARMPSASGGEQRARISSTPDGGPRARMPSASGVPRPGSAPDIPRPPLVPTFGRGPSGTQVGMIDPAALRESAGGPALQPRRIVDVTSREVTGPRAPAGGRSSPLPPAGAAPQKGPSSAPPRVSPVPAAATEGRASRPPPSPPPPPPPRPSRPPVHPPLSPPPAPPAGWVVEAAPITARLGSGDQPGDLGSAIDRAMAIRRSETGYSFVDKARRSSGSRRPGAREPEGPSTRRVSEPPPARRTSERPAAVPELLHGQAGETSGGGHRAAPTETGWAAPEPEPVRVTAIVDTRYHPPSDEPIEPRSVAGGWRPAPWMTEGADDEMTALRDRLLAREQRGCCVVGVVAGEDAAHGKSYVAARLAALLSARGNARVLLMDTNFDFPAIHDLMQIEVPHASGFSQQMRARIRSGQPAAWTVVECGAELHVLAEGVLRSPGILLTREFPQAIAELRRAYDFIVADGPTLGRGAEPKALDAVVDAVVLAVPPGQSLNEALDGVTRWFPRKDLVAAVQAPVAG